MYEKNIFLGGVNLDLESSNNFCNVHSLEI
jgi:hypothetical protein